MLDENFWIKYFKVYDALNLFLPYQKIINSITNELNIKKGEKALDVGCGSGNVSVLLSRKGANVVGIDFCKTALDICRQKDPSIETRLVDITKKFPFNDNVFDKIAGNNVLYTISKEKQIGLLKEIYRVLKPGGVFAMVNPIKKWTPIKIYFRGIKEHLKRDGFLKTLILVCRMISPSIKIIFYNKKIEKENTYYFFDINEQEILLKKAGFTNISETEYIYIYQALLTSGSK